MASLPRLGVSRKRVILIVFAALVLDLIAFTLPLPLFPRLVEHFLLRERESQQWSLLVALLHRLRSWRNYLLSLSASQSIDALDAAAADRYDVVLLGGLLGSIFSLAQWSISPRIGALSDKYGRKSVLLATMIGNFASNAIWMVSTSFSTFLASRVVGGLSEGNVQISTAILADVSSEDNRASALAVVGIAFSLCFTIGPPLGAYLAAKPAPILVAGYELNIYAVPAAIALAFLAAEVVLLVLLLPETKGVNIDASKVSEKKSKAAPPTQKTPLAKSPRLQALERLHLAFLFIFSGTEFTLTFLTFSFLGFTNKDNGKLLGAIGLLSCLIQGGYVRRKGKAVGPGYFLRMGLSACTLALASLAALAWLGKSLGARATSVLLWSGSINFAITTATVSTSLSTMASIECSEADKGLLLGQFRSAGQLGRALGPILVSSLYFAYGPAFCYATCCLGMSAILTLSRPLQATHVAQLQQHKKAE